MSSNRGIWRVRRADLEAVASGLRASVDSVSYGEADGMRDRECNGADESPGWRMHDGQLWFPTGKGVAAIDPAHLRSSRAPAAVLEGVRIDGELRRFTTALELAPDSNRIELAYTAPAPQSPPRLHFRYRLEGFDRGWNDAGAARVAQYTNLAPGEYRFVVQAAVDGTWGTPAALAFTLEPHFYQTRWFFALALASLAVIAFTVPALRVRQLRARARELDARIQEAVRELKVLSGLLPICAWCKKVRDDKGYWNRIEAYLSARTEAEFTHGICPECDEKMASGGHDHL
jgi:hypothetical protein